MPQYVKVDGARVGYVASGEGVPLLFLPASSSHVDMLWEHLPLRRFLDGLGAFARLIHFDHRGVGIADAYTGDDADVAEVVIADALAVLDAEGVEQTDLVACDMAGPVAIRFAARHPERVRRLVLINTCARLTWAAEYPHGIPPTVVAQLLSSLEQAWGTGEPFASMDPTVASDPRLREWWARYERAAISPAAQVENVRRFFELDASGEVPDLERPCLILHANDDPYIWPSHGRWLAEHLPDARLVEFESDGHLFWYRDADLVLREMRAFLTGEEAVQTTTRVLRAMLFTDIVGSTEQATNRGDAAWSTLLGEHDALTAGIVASYGGTVIKSTGDGVLATFVTPSAAVRCAVYLRRRLGEVGVQVRSGVHVGEIERVGADVAGIGVHIAARAQAAAQASEVLVTRTVRDVVAGCDLAFVSRGEHTLKGLAEPWELFAVG